MTRKANALILAVLAGTIESACDDKHNPAGDASTASSQVHAPITTSPQVKTPENTLDEFAEQLRQKWVKFNDSDQGKNEGKQISLFFGKPPEMTLRRTNDLITPFASEISGSVSIREPEASFTDNTSRVFLYRAVWSCEYRRGKWEMSSALKINAVSDESRVQLLIDIDRTHIWYAMQAFSANYNP